ncbi:MAG: hypothetical protein WA817_15205 [Candidatus Acidiferrum sp.]
MTEKPLFTFGDLTAVAADLNQASDDLTQIVTTVDSSLLRLNIGIAVWVEISKTFDESTPYLFEVEQLGYAKTEGNWGLTIRRLTGSINNPDNSKVRDVWVFNDAPRRLRLRAVEKLPELIDELTKSAQRTAERLKKKLAETRAYAASIGLLQSNDAKGDKS